MKVRITNMRLIFQNNWVGCGIVQAMHNISYIHACTHWVLPNQVSDVEGTTFSTFKVVLIIKLVCAVSYQCWISSVYQWVRGGGSICIRAVGDWRGPYLHILQFTLAHRTQLDFIQTGVKLSGGEIKPHFWKYSKSISKRRNIYLVKMGRNPSGPVWIISGFCSKRRCFFSS